MSRRKKQKESDDGGVDYELWKSPSQIKEFYLNSIGRPLAAHDRIVYAMRVSSKARGKSMFFFVIRKSEEGGEAGHWVQEAGNRVDDATEEDLNVFCEMLKDGDGTYGSANSETGFWET